MAVIEKLLTMGLAKGLDPRRMLLGAAGTGAASDKIEWTDVMRATSTLRQEQRGALYLKAAPMLMSGADFSALKREALMALIHHDHRSATYIRTNEATLARQIRIATTALTEYADPRTCRVCRASGKVHKQEPGKGIVYVPCVRCNGRGWVPWNDRRRARDSKVDHVVWPERYAAGYEAVLRRLGGLYREAVGDFKHALFAE